MATYRHPAEGRWRFSEKRLAELDALLDAIETEAETLDIGTRVLRFSNAADRDRYDELERQWKQIAHEKEQCRLALWRRKHGSIFTPAETA